MVNFRSPPIRSSPLGAWIAEHMPELHRELDAMTMDQLRIRLNEITGLDVQMADPFKASIDRYHAILSTYLVPTT